VRTAVTGAERRYSIYEKRGMDADKAPRALARALESCRCRKPCCKSLPLDHVVGLRRSFWSVDSTERSILLQSLACEEAAPSNGRAARACAGEADGASAADAEDSGLLNKKRAATRMWRISGLTLCFKSFCLIFGVSEHTALRMVNHCIDRRARAFCQPRGALRARAYVKRGKVSPGAAVDFFFYEIYVSAAEPLPKAKGHGRKAGMKVDTEISYENSPWLRAGESLCPEHPSTLQEDEEWRPDRPANEVLHRLTVASAELVPGIAQRSLPHQRLFDLYWVFQAAWEKIREHSGGQVLQNVPSYTTFHRRWTTVWSKYMRFRKSSEHAQCQTCFELLHQLRGAGPLAASAAGGAAGAGGAGGAPAALSAGESLRRRTEAARQLKLHYQHQYLDRCIYWSLRWASRSGNMSVLVIIMDSPDKTHFAWPRWPWERLPKCLEGLIRPRMTVTGVLAHGFHGSLEFSDEQLLHGADAFCEVLMLTLVRVHQICQRRRQPFPQHLVIQSDNTVAQCKNSVATVFLAYLVSAGWFATVTLNFLMVGHTHEDIDQLFGLMVQWILRKQTWEEPEELMEFLELKMRPQFECRGEEFMVRRLGAVRDFKTWLEPLGCHLYNAFGTRAGVEAPHSFAFKRRQDLSWSDRRARNDARGADGADGADEAKAYPLALPAHEPSPDDIFCCVKTYMRDVELQQEPVLTILADRGLYMKHAQPEPLCVLARVPLHEEVVKTLATLAHICGTKFGMPRAAAALQRLALDRSLVLPADRWLPKMEQQARVASTDNPYFPHLPATSWRLLARFQ
jgi:hypothetical protein